MQFPDVDITGAVIIERHFDSICKCSPIQAGSIIPYSALAVRTSHPTSFTPPQNIPQMRPFVAPAGPRPLTWYAQSLPFMNKTCWPRLYALQQQQTTKDPSTRPRMNNPPKSVPVGKSAIYSRTSSQGALRPKTVTFDSPSASAWSQPLPALSRYQAPPNRSSTPHPQQAASTDNTLVLSNPTTLFRSLLADNTEDPQSLLLQY